MPTDTFNYTGGGQSWTADNDGTVTIRITGAGGGSGGDGGDSGGDGGAGGYVEVDYQVSDGETLDIYVPGAGTAAFGDTPGPGGWGYYDGGSGGGPDNSIAGGGGGGAGAGAVLDGSDALIALAGGGGGGGGASGYDGGYWGGGGGGGAAESGEGGIGGGSASDGSDGSGLFIGIGGAGGDGGDDTSNNPGSPGGDGDYRVEQGSTITTTTGGGLGANSDGYIEIEYTTPPSTPSNLSAATNSADALDLTWDDVSAENGYYVYRARSSGSSTSDYTQVADLAADTTSYTDSGLLNGEQYYYRVSAYNEGGESGLSNEDSAVTVLPDVSAPSLGNGVEDEIGLTWTDAINYGSYRIQVEETDTGADWSSSDAGWVENTYGEGTTSDIITGREDGEEYRVRMRTETEHKTGAWTAVKTIITKFPGAANPSVSTLTDSSVTVSYNDNSDNEDGFRLHREEEIGGAWKENQIVGTAGANNTSITDGTVTPNTTYRYRVSAYTEHTEGFTSWTSVSTSGDDVETDKRIGSDAVVVEIEAPDGTIIRPPVGEGYSLNPQLNGLPGISVPTKLEERWSQTDLLNQPMRVWIDGERKPIDTLVEIEETESGVVLYGRGGSELLQKMERDVNAVNNDLLAEDAIQRTSYTADADNPDPDPLTNEPIQSADTTSELAALVEPIPDDKPFQVTGGGAIEPVPTAFVQEAENADNSGTFTVSDSNFSGGSGARHEQTNDRYEYRFTPQYDIPEEHVKVKVRSELLDSGASTDGIRWYLNGQEIWNIGGSNNWSLQWIDVETLTDYSNGDLQAGTEYTVAVETDASVSNIKDYRMDVVAVYDERYSYFWDNDNGGSGGYLDGPQTKPDHVPVEFDIASSPYSVEGGRAELTIDDVTGDQAIHLSNDGGKNYPLTASNTDTYEADFSDAGSSLRLKVDLSRYGSRSDQTPQTGFKTQTLDAYTLKGDLVDAPITTNEYFEDSIVSVLNQLANDGGFMWEVQGGDPFTVVYTRPGLRSTTEDARIGDYTITRDGSSIYHKVTVRGGSIPVENIEFESSYDTAVSLPNSHIVPSSEIVRDPSSGTVYERGADYQIDNLNGEITVLSGGSMSDSTIYEITHRYKVVGSYADSEYTGDPADHYHVDFPGAATVDACETIALQIIKKAKEPKTTIEMSVGTEDIGYNLSDSVAFEELPVNENLEVLSVVNGASTLSLTLGNRKGIDHIIEEEQRKLRNTIGRV
jgi:hypothetical protein